MIRLDQLIKRLVTYANCSPSVFVFMLIYADRVQHRCKDLRLTDHNVKRVVVAAFLAAVKFVEDRICAHTGYADLSGIDARELNGLEFLFNQAAQWTFFVTEDEYEACENDIQKR